MVEVPSLGSRGGGWVALQFVLMAAVAVAAVVGPPWPESVAVPLAVLGAAAGLAGVAIVALSVRLLGRSLTPFPRPTTQGDLVAHGPYRVVRHPIYAGGTLVFGGVSLFFSPLALVLSGVLALVWGLKLSVEERFLRAAYPDYERYCETTRWRLVPFVY